MRFIPKALRRTADISSGRSDWPTFLKNSLAVVIFFALLYVFLGLAADVTALMIPDRWEAKLFSWKYSSGRTDAPELGQARRVLDRLIQTGEVRPLPYKLFLLKDDDANAVALPGGGIGVTQGLLKEVKSEQGLAMVLAHELGHHQERHTLRELGRALLYQTAMAVMFGQHENRLVESGLKAAESRHSQRWERRADEFALELVRRSYGDTRGALEFFELIQKKEKSPVWTKYFSTHPAPAKRLVYLRELEAELEDRDRHP